MTEFEYPGKELDTFAQASNWKVYLRQLLAPRLRDRVLEVGTGIGATTRALWSERVSEWVCLEPDPSFVERLNTMKAKGTLPSQVEVRRGLTQDLPDDRHFDTILYIDVLEHIADDAGELHSAASHLAPGGTIIVVAPAWPWLFSEFDESVGHHRRYTRASLRAAVPRELTIDRIFFVDSVGLGFLMANRLLLRQSLPTTRQVRFWDRTAIPLSRVLDPLIGRSLGRSIIAILRKP